MILEIVKNECPLTSGQLIDALKSGEHLELKLSNGEAETITIENDRIYRYGWGSACGSVADRLQDIVDNPENYHIILTTPQP